MTNENEKLEGKTINSATFKESEKPSQMVTPVEPRVINFPEGLTLTPGQAIRVLEGGGYEIVGVAPVEAQSPPEQMAAETEPNEAIPPRRRVENQ